MTATWRAGQNMAHYIADQQQDIQALQGAEARAENFASRALQDLVTVRLAEAAQLQLLEAERTRLAALGEDVQQNANFLRSEWTFAQHQIQVETAALTQKQAEMEVEARRSQLEMAQLVAARSTMERTFQEMKHEMEQAQKERALASQMASAARRSSSAADAGRALDTALSNT
jgi:hypothetical protein